jgi:ABC-type bacteriocin/lantibiotic exporter with double-glycine peptidase domain
MEEYYLSRLKELRSREISIMSSISSIEKASDTILDYTPKITILAILLPITLLSSENSAGLSVSVLFVFFVYSDILNTPLRSFVRTLFDIITVIPALSRFIHFLQ